MPVPGTGNNSIFITFFSIKSTHLEPENKKPNPGGAPKYCDFGKFNNVFFFSSIPVPVSSLLITFSTLESAAGLVGGNLVID